MSVQVLDLPRLLSPVVSEAEARPDPRLVVRSRLPLNAEMPLPLQYGIITPNQLFFHRNHFATPYLTTATWSLRIEGEVGRPHTVDYATLLRLPARTLTVTLECAGNGRASFSPRAEGEQWELGAVSTAEWTGVPLSAVLPLAALRRSTWEILAEGADSGRPLAVPQNIHFARSLPLHRALHPDTLLAYAMNGEPLPARRGGPVRLIVPGWYGMASVKWLTRLVAIAEQFTGYFQRERYVVPEATGEGVRPVNWIAPRSIMLSPGSGETVRPGHVRVHGLAWSGHGSISLVKVSFDGGRSWRPARWTSRAERYAWRSWELWWSASPGQHELQCRATDAVGNTQPVNAAWNPLGYENNSIQTVRVICA